MTDETKTKDEGAAAIVDRLLDNIACATQNRALLVGDPSEDKVLTGAIKDNALQEVERLLNRAHPSPPKDRVRALEAAMKRACDLLVERTYGSRARSPGHNARLELEAALKSTAAKEG